MEYSINSLVFSNNGLNLAISFNERTEIWCLTKDYKNSYCMATLKEHHDIVNFASFSHDGRFLATGSNDSTVKIYGSKFV